MTNKIKIYTEIDGELISNFTFDEFENKLGWVILHEKIPWALEMTRAALNAMARPNIITIHVTNTTRTLSQLEQMGASYGWVDEGGKVARNSYHLHHFGGIAVDFYARNKTLGVNVPPKSVADVAGLYFDWVKAYDDGHVHGDFRSLVNR